MSLRSVVLTTAAVTALRLVRAINRYVRHYTGVSTDRLDEADRRALELEALILGQEDWR